MAKARRKKVRHNTRTLVRWLHLAVGACEAEAKKFAGMSFDKAWSRAKPDQWRYVQNSMPHASSASACWCKGKGGDPTKALVKAAFNRWRMRGK